LIEVAIAIAIMSILMTALMFVVSYFLREFKNTASGNREDFYINEAFRFIESEVHSDNKEVKFQTNAIELRKYSIDRIDYIRQIEGNLIIEYTTAGKSTAKNVFLKDISNFSIDICERLVIVNIVSSKGEVYSKCINTIYIK